MRYLKSLQVRLVASYLVLSFLVLSVTAVIFSAVLISYAQQVHAARMMQSYTQAATLLAEIDDTPDRARERLQAFFPELEVTATRAMVIRQRESPTLTEDYEPRLGIVAVRRLVLPAPLDNGIRITYLGAGITPTEFWLKPRQKWTVVLRDLIPHVAAVSVIALALGGLAGWWFSRRLARPIGRLAEATARVAGGNLAQVVPPTGMMELDVLVEQFNRMSGALSESFLSLAAERDIARHFAGDAAHELRTPLTALRGYAELASTIPERREQAMEAVGRQIDRLERIVNGLVHMAHISETGATAVEVDLTNLIRKALPFLQSHVKGEGHTLSLSLPDEPMLASADSDLLMIAMSNLVDNACKFTTPGGRISLCLQAEEDEVVLHVTDTGPGIAPEELPHIFKRFHRGIDTQALPGSGLGLPISQEAIARMGGRVTVTSEVGQGSCFTIRLSRFNRLLNPAQADP